MRKVYLIAQVYLQQMKEACPQEYHHPQRWIDATFSGIIPSTTISDMKKNVAVLNISLPSNLKDKPARITSFCVPDKFREFIFC